MQLVKTSTTPEQQTHGLGRQEQDAALNSTCIPRVQCTSKDACRGQPAVPAELLFMACGTGTLYFIAVDTCSEAYVVFPWST